MNCAQKSDPFWIPGKSKLKSIYLTPRSGSQRICCPPVIFSFWILTLQGNRTTALILQKRSGNADMILSLYLSPILLNTRRKVTKYKHSGMCSSRRSIQNWNNACARHSKDCALSSKPCRSIHVVRHGKYPCLKSCISNLKHILQSFMCRRKVQTPSRHTNFILPCPVSSSSYPLRVFCGSKRAFWSICGIL